MTDFICRRGHINPERTKWRACVPCTKMRQNINHESVEEYNSRRQMDLHVQYSVDQEINPIYRLLHTQWVFQS